MDSLDNIIFKEKKNKVYFSLPSFGLTSKEWISSFEKEYIKVDTNVKIILESNDFVQTIDTTNMVILKGVLFNYKDRTNKSINNYALKENLFEPSIEHSCLVRYFFSDEIMRKMGFTRIISMHKPITINHSECLIQSSTGGTGYHLMTCSGRSDAPPYGVDVGFLYDASNLKNFKRFLK